MCRHWCRALRQRSLLYDIQILHKTRLDKLIDLLHRLPSRGNQVEILKVYGGVDFDFRNFCNMFPNMRVFLNPSSIPPNKKYFNRPFEFTNPESKLEEIEDCGECELIRQLLVSARCNQLRILDLKLNVVSEPRLNLFPLLNNLPALESFVVRGSHFGILDCEMIHENVPSIKNLHIKNIHIKDDQFPENITPATSVTELKIELKPSQPVVLN